ncbi:MAG: PilZ domain-containing protein [Gemmataceae bacterium]|nr:PilZ domain-containing protein [Gemmataceae bacterium]
MQIQKAVKAYVPSTRQYVGGATADVSIGGVLLELNSARPLNIGDRIDVGVAWTGAPILPGERLVPSRVVRVHARRDGVQRLALVFVESQAMAAAA